MKIWTVAILVVALSGCMLQETAKKEDIYAYRGVPTDLGQKPPVELLMIFNPGNYFCQKFRSEIPLEYDMRQEGYYMPLVELDITAPAPGDWYRIKLSTGDIFPRALTTPTFIVWEGDRMTGHEIARFEGYTDKDSFYSQVNQLIEMYELKDPYKRLRHY